MAKSASFSTLLLVAALVLLSAVAAQVPTTTTTPAQVTSQPAVTTPAASGSGSPSIPTGGVPPPNFSGLGTLIASYDAGRSSSPGFAPTNKPGGSSAASSFHDASRSSVLTGLALAFATTLLAAIGTISL
ncbi:hypothetical protein BGX34_009135 [Mortierella sp. NVP85]|nr:hypothetical protein BGX34_009135 [Mortierella sp. NVP85]